MDNVNKVRAKYISAWVLAIVLLTLTFESRGKNIIFHDFYKVLTIDKDTLPKNDTIPKRLKPTISLRDTSTSLNKKFTGKDTTIITQDSFQIKISKDTLDAPVSYSADDSMVLDIPSKKIRLYGKKSEVVYKENQLSAPLIEFDQASGNVVASIQRDSAGKVIAMPSFNQGDFKSTSDSIIFNMKTGRGLTKSTYTQQGEMYVYGAVIKKVSNNIFYAQRGRFTTCDLDTPHFAFVSNRIKFISKKMAITGPVHPEFEGVPVPIYLPFGIYPLSQGRHSGILAPQFTANEQLGLGLEGLGYYKVLSDYWDVITRGNLYSYGGWTLSVNPRYMKKYRYSGNFSVDIQNFKYNFKGDPDYTKNRSYNFRWSHTVDSKARPGVSFSANVNAGSSSFNSFVPNNPYRNFSNMMSSSIVYSKTWKDKPFNLTVSANHNQNTNNKLINISLPDVGFNVNTLYPFRKKEEAGTLKWFENIGIAYNGNTRGQFSFYDTVPNILQHLKDTFQWGAHHSVPISLSLPQLGAFQISPNVSYDETWYQSKFTRSWDTALQKVDTSIRKGFYTARQVTFGVGVATKIIGMIAARNPNAKIQAIRHEIRPSVNFNYKPDLNKQYYYSTQIDTFKNRATFSQFDGNIFGPYSPGRFGGVSFALDNNFQMKVRDKKDTTNGGLKKVTLLDALSITGNYNLMADSFPLSNLDLNARTNLFDKINITANASFDPYDVDARGNRLKTLVWQHHPISFGHLVGGNVSLSTQFQGGSKDKNASKVKNTHLTNDYALDNGYTPDEMQNELDAIRRNPGEYADFNIPWSFNFSYSLRFNRIRKSDYSGYTTDFGQDVNWSGTVNLTPKWQVGVNGFYNITQAQLGTLAVSISREMHCWQMSINLSPIGRYRFFNITISPKSGLLRDLKVNRTRYFYDL